MENKRKFDRNKVREGVSDWDDRGWTSGYWKVMQLWRQLSRRTLWLYVAWVCDIQLAQTAHKQEHKESSNTPRRRGSNLFSSISLALVPASIRSSLVRTPMVRTPKSYYQCSEFKKKSQLHLHTHTHHTHTPVPHLEGRRFWPAEGRRSWWGHWWPAWRPRWGSFRCTHTAWSCPGFGTRCLWAGRRRAAWWCPAGPPGWGSALASTHKRTPVFERAGRRLDTRHKYAVSRYHLVSESSGAWARQRGLC